MQNAIYNSKSIFALDLVYPYVEEYKTLSKECKLLCPCCKKPVILRYGDKKLPHFAHKESNANCLLSAQNKEKGKLVEEAQKDIFMRLRNEFKTYEAQFDLNMVENNELIHVYGKFVTGEEVKIRLLSSDYDKLLDGCIHIYVYNSSKDFIDKKDVFNHTIKYNINTRKLIRGYFNIKTNELTNYLLKIEDFLINKDNTINLKLFKKNQVINMSSQNKNTKKTDLKKLKVTDMSNERLIKEYPNLFNYLNSNEDSVKKENRIAFYLRLILNGQTVNYKYSEEKADMLYNGDVLRLAEFILGKDIASKIRKKAESKEYLSFKK